VLVWPLRDVGTRSVPDPKRTFNVPVLPCGARRSCKPNASINSQLLGGNSLARIFNPYHLSLCVEVLHLSHMPALNVLAFSILVLLFPVCEWTVTSPFLYT